MGKIKKNIIALLAAAVLMAGIALPHEGVAAMGMFGGLEAQFGGFQDQIADFFNNLDAGKAAEVFEFVREKVADGSLKTQEGIEAAIEAGEERFGTEFDKEIVESFLDIAVTLEDMGFDTEAIIDNISEMYEEHGADIVNHFDEIVRDAVSSSWWRLLMNGIGAFFRSMGNAISGFFRGLF